MPKQYAITAAILLTSLTLLSVTIARSHGADAEAKTATPLVLQPADGEHRMRRPPPASLSTLAAPFIIKVDERNGGAKDFVLFTKNVPPAWLHGKKAKIVPGTIIFMPVNTGVSLTNDGNEPISLVVIFSRPGFDKYQRDISVPALRLHLAGWRPE